jgi:large subunit ribosomal protein L31
MKQGIHPKYYPNATVICSCGNTWTTGSTVEVIRTDVCSACHPFFTGEQRIVDTAGQVDRYQKRLKRYKEHVAEEKTRLEQTLHRERDALLKQQIEALDLSERVHKALAEAGLVSLGDVVKMLEAGDRELLAVEGVGPKALEEVKDRLQAIGLIPA